MSRPLIRHGRLLILLATVALPLAAATAPASPGARQQIRNVIPETYSGRFEFTDASGKRVEGNATLVVGKDKMDVTLTDGPDANAEYRGDFITLITRHGIPSGNVHFVGDREIPIRWIQCDADTQRLKIVGEKKNRNIFRFCSKKVYDDGECYGRLRPPCIEAPPPRAPARRSRD